MREGNVPGRHVRALKRAAESGQTDAQYNLACAYVTGEGVRRNRVLGLKWLIIAAGRGDSDAELQCNLLSEELSEIQERRAVAGALRWKFRFMLDDLLGQLLNPETRLEHHEADENQPLNYEVLPHIN